MFKIGDIVEGEKDGRWVRGYIVDFAYKGVYIHVITTKITNHNVTKLHDRGGAYETKEYWHLDLENLKIPKEYVVKQIIKDL